MPKICNEYKSDIINNQHHTQDDNFRDILTSMVAYFKISHQKGVLALTDRIFKTKYSSSRNILVAAFELVTNGRGPEIINYIINTEYMKAIRLNPSIDEKEIDELTLAKELVNCMIKYDADMLYYYISFLCTDDFRNEVVPNAIEWINTP